MKLKKFTADAVIENHSFKNIVVMFKLDAKDVIKIENNFYHIGKEIVRSCDHNIDKIELRCRYTYGAIKRGQKKTLYNKHLFNVDMLVFVGDDIYVTPIYYFYENSRKRGEEQINRWLLEAFGSNPISASKTQIKAVMKWVVDIYSSTNKPVADFLIHQKASSMIVDCALSKLVDANYLTQQSINHEKGSFNVYIPTPKGKSAMAKV